MFWRGLVYAAAGLIIGIVVAGGDSAVRLGRAIVFALASVIILATYVDPDRRQ